MDTLQSPFTQNFLKHNASTIQTHFKNPHFKQTKLNVATRTDNSTLTHQVFDEIPLSDTFAWNTIIKTHLSANNSETALLIYCEMLLRGVRPDKHTLPRVLSASCRARNFCFGRQVHCHAVKLGFAFDQYVVTALIELYGRLEGVDFAKWLFDKSPRKNSVSWTMIARLYLLENKPRVAVDLFYRMVELGTAVDNVALVTAIGACGHLNSTCDGRKVHEIARKCGLEDDLLVSNSLMKMYIDCGSMEYAREIFDRMPLKDVISWTEVIGGYVKNGGFNEGLKLFRQMVREGIKPDALSITSVLPSCARMAAHKNGKEIHGCMIRNGIDGNLKLNNAILDMYVKAGFIESASKVFERMRDKDVISWTVMIFGYSLHGQGKRGIELFREMENDSRIQIDQFAYSAALHACCTARMVDEGRFYFNCIKAPDITHYALKVALLARVGHFNEARIFIEEQQLGRHVEVLRALLDGCRIHKETQIGKRVIEQLSEMEPLNAENCVLLSNCYAHFEKQDMVDKLRSTIKDMGVRPNKACSWIELRNKVHVFVTGDTSHPRSEAIYWELQHLSQKIEDEGHQSNLNFSFHDVDEERECIQIGHSELLAISFGLISTQAGATIRVTKNHRVCSNCHDFAKVLSKVVGREIIVKDPDFFHHFKDGYCSHGDYW